MDRVQPEHAHTAYAPAVLYKHAGAHTAYAPFVEYAVMRPSFLMLTKLLISTSKLLMKKQREQLGLVELPPARLRAVVLPPCGGIRVAGRSSCSTCMVLCWFALLSRKQRM